MRADYAETLSANLKSWLGKDSIRVVCPCTNCTVMLPITIDDLAQKLQADGVEYDNHDAFGKWCHKYIQDEREAKSLRSISHPDYDTEPKERY